MPGETFRLPSGGLFYEPGILSEKVVDGEFHVFPMTAIDEIALKTPDLLFSGEAVTQIFNRCIPDVLQPKKLLAKDVDFLLICLKKVSFGPLMEMTYNHKCGESAKENHYMIPVDQFLKRAKRIDPSRVGSDFSVTLINGQIVSMEPISFEGYIELMQAEDKDISLEKQVARLCLSVSKVIKSVDNVTDKKQIQEWLTKIPPVLMKQITECIEKTTEWGPDFIATIKCRDCGQEVQVQAPLNPLAFFT
jgi:hypothetical protein